MSDHTNVVVTMVYRVVGK